MSIVKEKCKENDIRFIDMFEELDPSHLDDGLHPNTKGYEKMYGIIKDFLSKNEMI